MGTPVIINPPISYPPPIPDDGTLPPPSIVNQIGPTRGPANEVLWDGDGLPTVYGTARVQGKPFWQDTGNPGWATFFVAFCNGPISAIQKVFINGIDIAGSAPSGSGLIIGASHVDGSGHLTSVDITNGGSGYTIPPAIYLTGGIGSGGVVHAVLTGGVVTSIAIDNPGYYPSAPTGGYSNPPGISYEVRTGTLDSSNEHWCVTQAFGSSHYFPGVSYIVLWVTAPQSGTWMEMIPNFDGQELTFAAEIDGQLCYNPDTSQTVFTRNPAIILRDWLTDPDHGCGEDSADLDWASFSAAKTACDYSVNGKPRYEINGVVASKSTGDVVLSQMLLACNGSLVPSAGLIGLWVDAQQSTPVLDLSTLTNCREVNFEPVTSGDFPTRITVTYGNADKRYTGDSILAEHPSLPSGGIDLRESQYDLAFVSREEQAHRIAYFLMNRALINFKVTCIASFGAAILTRGSLVTLTTLGADGINQIGLDHQKMLVFDYDRESNGEYKLTLLQYADAVYNEYTITPSAPLSSKIQNPFAAPPDPFIGSCTPVNGDNPLSATGLRTTWGIYPKIANIVPPAYSLGKRFRVRSGVFSSSGQRDAATWDSMAAGDMGSVPLTGNLPPSAGGSYNILVNNCQVGTDVVDYAATGATIAETVQRQNWKVIIRLENDAGILSSGLTYTGGSAYTYSDFTAIYGSLPLPPYTAWRLRHDMPEVWWEGPFDQTEDATISAGMTWSYTGTTGSMISWNAAYLTDGNTTTSGIVWSPGGSFKLQGVWSTTPTRYVNRAKFTFAGSTTHPSVGTLEVSQDGSTWVEIAQYGGPTDLSWVGNVGTITWGLGNYSFKYWRISIGGNDGNNIDLREIVFSYADLKQNVGGWNVYEDTNYSGSPVIGRLIGTVPRGSVPTRDSPCSLNIVQIENFIKTTGQTELLLPIVICSYADSRAVIQGSGLQWCGDTLVTRTKLAQESTGQMQGLSVRAESSPAVSVSGEARLLMTSDGVVRASASGAAYFDVGRVTDYFGGGSKIAQVDGSTTYSGFIGATTNVIAQLYAAESQAAVYLGSRSNHPVIFTVNNAEKMRIGIDGNALFAQLVSSMNSEDCIQAAAYGVVANGSLTVSGTGTDQTTAFVNALTAAITAGKKLRLPAGIIKFTQNVVIPDIFGVTTNVHVQIEGAGCPSCLGPIAAAAAQAGGTILKFWTGAGINGLSLTPTNSIAALTLKDLEIQGPDTDATATSGNGVTVTGGATRCVFYNVDVNHFRGGKGYNISAPENGSFINVSASYNDVGFSLNSAANANHAYNLAAQYCATRGVEILGSTTVHIHGGLIQNNPKNGLYVNGSTNINIEDIHFEGNNTTGPNNFYAANIWGTAGNTNNAVRLVGCRFAGTNDILNIDGSGGGSYYTEIETCRFQSSNPIVGSNAFYTLFINSPGGTLSDSGTQTTQIFSAGAADTILGNNLTVKGYVVAPLGVGVAPIAGSELRVASTSGVAWTAGGTSTAGVILGAGTTGTGLWVNTPSSAGYNSGFAVDGTFATTHSVVNLTAYGLKAAGYDSAIAIRATVGTSVIERMRIDPSGNLGLRTAVPAFDAEVVAASNGTNCVVGITSCYGGISQFLGRSSRGTLTSPSASSQNDMLAFFGGRGYGATGWAGATSAAMVAYASESWTDSAQGAYWTIETTPNGSTGGSRAERLRVDQDGTINATLGPYKLSNANGAVVGLYTATELLTVAAAATSDTVGNLLPAGAVVVAVTCRVTTTIPTATGFTLAGATDAVAFTGTVGVSAGSTDNGVTHWVNPGRIVSSASQKIRLTIVGSNPANNSGRVRITLYYFLPTAPTS